MSTKVQMPSLVSTMLIRQQEEFNMFEGSTCNCFRPMWKLAFCAMTSKVSWTTSWVLMHSLSWTQRKRWIPKGLMGCVHTHQKIFVIKGWGSSSHIRSVVEKIGEVNWKFGKISWTISQTPTPGLEHDRIWAWWALNILLDDVLKKVWWCRHSKMESWSWIVCCPMNCSNKRKHVWIGGNRKSHVAFKCC
jgi:hypothetical protein